MQLVDILSKCRLVPGKKEYPKDSRIIKSRLNSHDINHMDKMGKIPQYSLIVFNHLSLFGVTFKKQ